MRNFLAIAFILSLASCDQNSTDATPKPEAKNPEKNKLKAEYDTDKCDMRWLPDPIVLSDLYKIDGLDWTGSVATANGTFCDSTSEGFYGIYNLLDLSASNNILDNPPHAGTITVYRKRDNTTWGAGDTIQEFRQINIQTPIIPIWDSIAVGMNKADLINFIGIGNFQMDQSTLLADLFPFTGVFSLKNETVTKIEITRKCEKP